MKYAFVLASVATLLTGQAFGSAVHYNRALKSFLQARQSPGGIDPGSIPAQCTSVCAQVVQISNECASNEESCLSICTNQVMSGVAQCFSCELSADATTTPADVATAQADLEELENDCQQLGDPVGPFTVSGGAAPTVSASQPAASRISSASVPPAQSPSIFFSSSGATPPSAPTSSADTSSQFSAPPPVSHQTISVLSTPGAPTPGAPTASASTPLNPPATSTVFSGGGSANSAPKSISIASSYKLVVAGIFGGALFAL